MWSPETPAADGFYWFYGQWDAALRAAPGRKEPELLLLERLDGTFFRTGDERLFDDSEFIGLWLPVLTPTVPKESIDG